MTREQEHSIDLSRILDATHENKWVAILPDYSRVLASADSLIELARSVKDAEVVYHRVLPRGVTFAPATLRDEI